MNLFEHLNEKLGIITKDIHFGIGKTYEDFREETATNRKAFFISWNGIEIVNEYEDMKLNQVESFIIYYKTYTSPDKILEEIDEIIDLINGSSFTKEDKKYISTTNISPIYSDTFTVIGIEGTVL